MWCCFSSLGWNCDCFLWIAMCAIVCTFCAHCVHIVNILRAQCVQLCAIVCAEIVQLCSNRLTAFVHGNAIYINLITSLHPNYNFSVNKNNCNNLILPSEYNILLLDLAKRLTISAVKTWYMCDILCGMCRKCVIYCVVCVANLLYTVCGIFVIPQYLWIFFGKGDS